MGDLQTAVTAYLEALDLSGVYVLVQGERSRVLHGRNPNAHAAALSRRSGQQIDIYETFWVSTASQAEMLCEMVWKAVKADRRCGACRLTPSEAAATVRSIAESNYIETKDYAQIMEEASASVQNIDKYFESISGTKAMKYINSLYKAYRISTINTGCRCLPYAKWLSEYKKSFIVTVANTAAAERRGAFGGLSIG